MSSKRTRVLVVAQSKGGCRTCKLRRVKCDETKPSCLRCLRSRRECAGYSEPSTSASDSDSPGPAGTPSTTPNTNATGSISTELLRLTHSPTRHPDRDSETLQLGWIASTVLRASTSGLGQPFWESSLANFEFASPTVSAALAAVGAALNLENSTYLQRSAAKAVAFKHYGTALRLIQEDINRVSEPDDALMLSCLLLAITDVMQWRELQSLAHLQGAFEMLRHRPKRGRKAITSSASEDAVQVEGAESHALQDDVDLVCYTLDTIVSSYALGRPPRLPRPDIATSAHLPDGDREIAEAMVEAMSVSHNAFAVAQEINPYKYRPHAAPHAIIYEQGRICGQLQAVIQRLSKLISAAEAAGQTMSSSTRQLYLHRSHCMSVFIYVSTLLCPYEVGYDAYIPLFEQMVLDAEACVKAENNSGESQNPYRRFNPGLGVIPPLYFTAIKCRDPGLRRRAIEVLAQRPREAPFHGKALAAVSQHVVRIEEEKSEIDENYFDGRKHIPERWRVCGLGLYLTSIADTGLQCFEAKMSRCPDVEAMLTSPGEGWRTENFWETITVNVSF